MMSGMRNAPPISISSPRETITSRPSASAFSTSSTAAALLLTAVAASAPVSLSNQGAIWSSRSPRAPPERSYSSVVGERMASTAAWMASSASCARPRLVCNTVPVRLKTRRCEGRTRSASRASHQRAQAASSATSASPRLASAQTRSASITSGRPARSINGANAGQLAMRSIEGGRPTDGWASGALLARSARDTVFPQDGRAGPGARRPLRMAQPGRPINGGSGLLPGRLLAGGGHADADQDQYGRRRQADHERELGRRGARLVLQKRNNGRHVNPHVSNPAGPERTPSPLLASALAL